ncbi:MAG: hypothetical protein FWD47_12390 [Treponema sp.]|nr:hypothetical protein [Treponema sp.]
MVILKNAYYAQFLAETKSKRIICFGTGILFTEFIKYSQERIALLEKIDYILDNNPAKKDAAIDLSPKLNLNKISITTVEDLMQKKVVLSEYVIILTVFNENIQSIISQLDNIPQFDNVSCYLGISALLWGREPSIVPLGTKSYLPKCKNEYNIPKVIHYCWFGCNKMTEIEKECIESWKKHCPDYEIKLWNEENYDISDKPLYVRQAYEAKKYAFVSDYARLDIIYKHGGFYLDADVFLLKNLDDFINYKAVFAYSTCCEIATGLGFGSVADNKIIKEHLDIYERILFVNGGELNLTPCPLYSTDYFSNKGIDINNRLHLNYDTLYLPSDFLCPIMSMPGEDGIWSLSLFALTENSYAIHLCTYSWMEKDDLYKTFCEAKIKLGEINKRLLSDWQKCTKNA